MYSSDFSADLSNSTVFDDSFDNLSNGVKSEDFNKSQGNSPRHYIPKLYASNSKRNEEVIFFSLEDELIGEQNLFNSNEMEIETKQEDNKIEFEIIGNEVNYGYQPLDNHKDFMSAEVKEEPSNDFPSRLPSCTCEFSSSMFHEHLCPFRELNVGEVVRSNAFVFPDGNLQQTEFHNFKI